MKIFIDTAKLEEIEKANSYGILDGVTINPSLIKKAVDELNSKLGSKPEKTKKSQRLNLEPYIRKILRSVNGPVSLEVIGVNYDEMVQEGKRLFRTFNPVAGNVYIKIPASPAFEENSPASFDSIRAIKELSKAKIPVNCTLIFTPEQALLAAKAGAKIVSPFAGRIDDYIREKNGIQFRKEDYFPSDGWKKDNAVLEDNGVVSGIDLVRQCRQVFDLHNIKTEVLAASIRNPRQAREAARAGADIATLPFDVMEKLLYHHKTAEGMKNFTKDIVEEYSIIVRGRKEGKMNRKRKNDE